MPVETFLDALSFIVSVPIQKLPELRGINQQVPQHHSGGTVLQIDGNP
jgi:hypothetical protein